MKVRTWIALALIGGVLAPTGMLWGQVSPESAEKYTEGQGLFGKRRYRDALKSFEAAVDLDGKNAQAYRAIGRTYQSLRDYPKAIEAYQMAVAVKPDYAAVYLEMGQLQFQQQRKYGDAQASFQKVLEIDPGFESGKARGFLKAAYAQQGNLYFRQRNYKKAAQEYSKASQLDPTDATTFYNLGLAHWRGRNHDKAVSALNTAVDLDPNYPKAYKALGDLYRTTRKHSAAIKAYSKAVRIDPKMEKAYINLAATYISTEQPAKAASILNKALAQGLTDAKVHSALGSVRAQQKDWAKAISNYKNALAVKSNFPEARYRLAVAYFETQQYDAGIAQAKMGAKSSRFKVPSNVILGDIYEAMKGNGWKERAISHYELGVGNRQYKKYCEDKIDRIKNPMGLGAEAAAEDQ